MSEGFNPRPRISFPLSLALGVEGREEVAEIQLTDWMAPAEAGGLLRAALPEGVEVTDVTAVDPRRSARVVSVTYLVEHPAVGRLDQGDLEALLARDEVPVTRPGKGRSAGPRRIDIRPYLTAVTLERGGSCAPVLRAEVRVTTRGTARPEEILVVASAQRAVDRPQDDTDPLRAMAPRIVRERVVLAGQTAGR